MTMDLGKVPVDKSLEQAKPAGVPAAVDDRVVRPPPARPLDWSHAVNAAAARLEESWVRPDSTGHMLASGLAEELAATLCAFGMVASEVDHMRGHAVAAADDEPPPPG